MNRTIWLVCLLLTASVASAGCVGLSSSDPVDAASVGGDTSPDEPATSEQNPNPPADEDDAQDNRDDGDDAAADDEAPDDAAPASDPDDAPRDDPASTSEPMATPAPWRFNESLNIGPTAAITVDDETRESQLADGWCDRATFALPAGASVLEVRLAWGPERGAESQGGAPELRVTAPDGSVHAASVDPNAPGDLVINLTAPAAGTWGVHIGGGPVAGGRAWVTSVLGIGQSIDTPDGLRYQEAC